MFGWHPGAHSPGQDVVGMLPTWRLATALGAYAYQVIFLGPSVQIECMGARAVPLVPSSPSSSSPPRAAQAASPPCSASTAEPPPCSASATGGLHPAALATVGSPLPSPPEAHILPHPSAPIADGRLHPAATVATRVIDSVARRHKWVVVENRGMMVVGGEMSRRRI